jgi:peroxiredoxin (alkyl hydroperoxide reductase subunit C)
MDEILRMIEGFHTLTEKKVAIPANWPNNELIGKGLIIPPAADVETAKERTSEYKCFDWWLCYRNYYQW